LIVDENTHEPMTCIVYSRIEKAVLFVGAHPQEQKRWMTLGSHPWVNGSVLPVHSTTYRAQG